MKKSTLILTVVLASLLAYIFIFDIPSERKKKEESKLLPWKSEEVSAFELRIKAKKLDVRVVRKGRDIWEIVSPVKTGADDTTIMLMFGALKDATKEKVADSGDLKEYGLDDPVMIFSVESKKGKKIAMLFGKENPITAERYLKLKDKSAIYLVAPYVFKELNKDLFALRQKDMLTENTISIESFTMTYIKTGKKFSFKRDKESLWGMVYPAELPVDQDKLTDILWDVVEGKADKIIDNPKDLKKYGLDSPQLVVELNTKKGKKYDVLYSWSKDGDYVWGMVKGGNSVYKFGRYFPKDLKVSSVNQLLDKRPLRSNYYSLTAIDVIYPDGKKISIKQEKDKWVGAKNADKIARALSEIEAKEAVYNEPLPSDAKLAFKVIAKDAVKEVKVEFYEVGGKAWAKDLDYPIVYKFEKPLKEIIPSDLKK